MHLTHHGHACVGIDGPGGRLVIDPGAFTPGLEGLLERADAVLITHEHFDHVDVAAVSAAVSERPELAVYAPEGVIGSLGPVERGGALAGGERIEVAGFAVDVVGGDHAPIHPEIAVPANLGYLVTGPGGSVFHPGDSYATPPGHPGTLLVPVSGPWVSWGRAIDWIRDIAPRESVLIHEAMLSGTGLRSAGMFLGADGPAHTPLLHLGPEQALDLATGGVG
ncbi:hypothetical protein SRB5_07200 [Streptomyces sp. RB5]|uniref:Metallo-beta-lactamase domain-containing protein n=1 Tax=Streptomyces smaragdinus TaxID=2585196 RepID=A0A7K0CAZ1_9ACTN|nr:MBL fold metallo-hydrolase [Streptomyces smaragdinus]MQY10609.1 hypothetical protein [Streptomyces smaragdinus]